MLIAAVTDVGYLVIIVAQGDPSDLARLAFVAIAICTAAVCAGVGATRARAIDRLPWLGAATRMLLVLGYPGLFVRRSGDRDRGDLGHLTDVRC